MLFIAIKNPVHSYTFVTGSFYYLCEAAWILFQISFHET